MGVFSESYARQISALESKLEEERDKVRNLLYAEHENARLRDELEEIKNKQPPEDRRTNNLRLPRRVNEMRTGRRDYRPCFDKLGDGFNDRRKKLET